MSERIKILLSALLICVIKVNAVNISTADSAYNAGDFTLAASLYNEIAESEGTSAQLLYNLGNAYYRSDETGKAVVAYERALKLSPGNKTIKNNLNYIRGKVEDANKAELKGKQLKVTEDTPTFFQNIRHLVAEERGSDIWAFFGAGSFILFITCVALYLFTANVTIRKAGFFGGMILFVISIGCVLCSIMAADIYKENDNGVLNEFKNVLLVEPDADSDVTGRPVLTRGTKVRIIGTETDASGEPIWYKVRLNSDFNGWVPAKNVVVI